MAHLQHDGDRAASQHALACERAVQQRKRDGERPLQALPPCQERLGVRLVRRLTEGQQVVQVRWQLVRHVLRCRDAIVAVAHHKQAAVRWPAGWHSSTAFRLTKGYARTTSLQKRLELACCDPVSSHLSAGLTSLPERISSEWYANPLSSVLRRLLEASTLFSAGYAWDGFTKSTSCTERGSPCCPKVAESRNPQHQCRRA